MPGKIKVKVLAGRNLPVMDRASETTDAFVEIKFGGVTHKTDVCRKSLNPHWNSAEWYRFEVDEWELQDEPLQLRLMDHDTYSANDAIGKIVLSLAPLLASANTHHSGAMMSGWLPVFDTLHGIRGELNIVVKVELFSDCNKYKTSSCGVQFYHCPSIPPGSVCTGVHGFVEELVVNADPEYQWIDKIRTPRASNEARQVAFIKLSNQVQRLVGVKAAELGANAVVGYQQHFDLEGEAGVVARAIGTAVSLAPPPAPAHPVHAPPTQQEREKESPRHARHESCGSREPISAGREFSSINREAASSGRDSAPANRESPAPNSQHHNVSINSSSTPLGIHRRSSDSDLSVTPKGGSLNTSGQAGSGGGGAILRPSMNSHNLELLEYPFLTMTHYPPGFIVHIGGTVCARSVKLIEGGAGAGEGSAGRAAWWAELRTELRAHARALRCNAVIAYSETAAICEDVCVVSASGTAAVINLDCDYNAGAQRSESNGRTMTEENETAGCSMAHVPYAPGAGPYVAELEPCATCRSSRVPTVLLATCALPPTLHAAGPPIVITAVAGRVRRAQPSAEPGARDISDQLPFLEYELHKLLLAKLRMQGANAVFSLQTQIAVGERCVMALATGCAVKLMPLPAPAPPIVNLTNPSDNEKEALEIQKQLREAFNANITANGYDVGAQQISNGNGVSEMLESKGEPLELSADKHAAILQLDEYEDVQTARLLCAKRARLRVLANDARAASNRPPHAFVQVLRGRLSLSGVGVSAASGAGERIIARALEATAYKLRRLHPYALGPTAFSLDLPEDEIQLVVCGAAIPLAPEGTKETNTKGTEPEDDIFALDEEQLHRGATANEKTSSNGQLVPIGNGGNVGFAGVCMTSLPTVGGAKATRRVCALRLLFIRETTAVRELGGMSGFLHTTLTEALCVVRATCVALGGNALTSFHTHQHLLQDNAHKNQGQCLLSVGGDVVHVTY